MPSGVRFSPEIEQMVAFVEETDPADIIDRTLARLRDGTPPKDLLRAGDLAVARSTELPAHHHGGPIHPVAGTYPVYHTSQLLSDEMAYLPIVQHVTLCNKHLHAPNMGPYVMPETVAMAADEGGVEATGEAMRAALQTRHPALAEKHLLWLLENASHGEVMDAILTKAVPKNLEDDHFFLFPAFTSRALDCIGWEWAPVLMRPPVRYLSQPYLYTSVLKRSTDFAPFEALLDEYRLLENGLPLHTTSRETEAIGELADRIGHSVSFDLIPEMLAKAMGGGLSLEGTAEALSIAAATIFLRTSYGNPMDAHLHTGINVRRYLLNMDGVSLRNKVLCLLSWHTGPEILLSENKLDWEVPAQTDPPGSPARSQDNLLDAITEMIEAQPEVDWATIGRRLDLMVAPPEVREALNLGCQYAFSGHDPMALFTRTAEIGCRDDFTEMHVFKQHQAIVEEYYTTREPYRWVHLVSAAKAAAVVYGKRQDVYNKAKELIKV
ncbi:MAG: hypothetical protein IIB12_09345 [Chloroflexi bacterium]|nr:hypothetical protein [Chloroflexota bacterium]MCI0768920.1 hypothetical protein [Chloroflexota bacterium]